MSRFLRRLKKKRRPFIAVITVLFVVLVCFLGVFYKNLWLFVIAALIIGALVIINLDRRVTSILNQQYRVFDMKSLTRNVDCLIIGDMIDPSFCIKKGESFVQIAAPKRGFLSDYELLRHTHSILKADGGRVCIVYRANCVDKGLYLFDYPIFHITTINRYHLTNKIKSIKHPMFHHPICSIIMACDIRAKKGIVRSASNKEIVDFCYNRGYEIEFIEIN